MSSALAGATKAAAARAAAAMVWMNFTELSPSCPSERNAAGANPQAVRSLGGFSFF
jgi:hypothetical protein